jgi:hypothetical protein
VRRGLLAGVAFVLAGLAVVAEGVRRPRAVWKQVGRWSVLIPVVSAACRPREGPGRG